MLRIGMLLLLPLALSFTLPQMAPPAQHVSLRVLLVKCAANHRKPRWRLSRRLQKPLLLVAGAVIAGGAPAMLQPPPAHAVVSISKPAPVAATMLVTNVVRPWRAGARRNGGRISDAAGVIDSQAEAHIMDTIRQTESEHGTEMMVVTLDSIGGQNPKLFATALFNEWGVGPADKNNGVLVLVVKDTRRIEVEVGRGLNGRFDRSWTESMIEQKILPRFKAGDYGEGLARGIDALSDRFEARVPDWVANAAIYLGLGGVISAATIVSDRRARTCGACGAVVDQVHVGSWMETKAAGYLVAGKEERTLYCTCGKRTVQSRSIRAYDQRRRGSNGEWIYYRSSSSDSDGGGGSSDGGGGGGGSW